MLSPCAYRAALLDLLTSSASESQEMASVAAEMDMDRTQADPAQARRSYVPSLRLTRRSAPSLAKGEKRAAGHMTPATITAAASPPSPPVAPVNETPSTPASHCMIEDSVLSPGKLQARVRATPSRGRSGARQCLTHQPASVSAVVEEQRPSLILSFIDSCICAGVPEALIAEQVQFMVSSMKESLTLHAALHARQHKDRIREYELSELAAILERQQLQFAQQQMAPPVFVSDPALSSSSQVLAPPPPLRVAPPQRTEPDMCSSAGRVADVQPFRYTPISQRLSNDLWSASATRCESLLQYPGNRRPSLSSRHARSRAGHNLQDGAGSSPAVPVFSWRPRMSAHASATEAPAAPAARFMNPDGGAAAESSSTGHVRDTLCRHRRHHTLCSVCYPTSSSVRSSSLLTAHTAAVTASSADDGFAAQRCSAAAKWRQRRIPSQHYMKPTHTSLSRWESKAPSVSPLRETPPGTARSRCEDDYVKLATSRQRRGDNSPPSTRGAASAVAGCRTAPLKLIVRSTHSSRLRVAATSRRQASSSASASAASFHDEDGTAEGELDVRGDAAVASARTRREGSGCLGESHIPESQRSAAPSAAAVPHDSLRATLAQKPTSVVRIDPWPGAPSPLPSHCPSPPDASAPRGRDRLSIDHETPLNASIARSSRDGAAGMTSAAYMASALLAGGGNEKPPCCSTAASSASSSAPAAFASGPTVQRFAHSQVTQKAVEERQLRGRCGQHVPERRPHQPRSSPRGTGSVLNLPVFAASVVDDDCSNTNVCVSSPELQLFMERSRRKVRETEQVLARAPTPSCITSVSYLGRSPSTIPIVNASQSRALRDSTAVSSCALTSSADAQQTSSLAKDFSGRSLDVVSAQQQQRLAELRQRLSNYATASATRPSAVVDELPHELQQSTSVIFQPHDAPPVLLDNSPLTQISPTSSDNEHDE
ncbi:hypothetical protein GH5_04848 [Leishmania sp. Ghana 2012 LV757]|uniref:hypothetical protein n=1 Tax=Leishmania sp. Ghana 2012 LV757 TaxID=2803181 RepID=UPI001B69747B|nr:hypothetical protein GH5_04848 [Leishmania sp. Ghana 2012 LV757]